GRHLEMRMDEHSFEKNVLSSSPGTACLAAFRLFRCTSISRWYCNGDTESTVVVPVCLSAVRLSQSRRSFSGSSAGGSSTITEYSPSGFVGWLIRTVGGAWTCLPSARRSIPRPMSGRFFPALITPFRYSTSGYRKYRCHPPEGVFTTRVFFSNS